LSFASISAATGICGASLRCGTMQAHSAVSTRHSTASKNAKSDGVASRSSITARVASSYETVSRLFSRS
jgi:hypothetical protein